MPTKKFMEAHMEGLSEANRLLAHCKKTEGLRLTSEPVRPKG